MALQGFISYSHADQGHLDRLHKHLAMLNRDGTLKGWTDHQIIPGSNLDDVISVSLEASDIFIALVSADYLDSRYCFDVEFQRALTLEQSGMITIVPVILEPCDWLSSPLSRFKALPKDGRAVGTFTNLNIAYLDIVDGLRRVATAFKQPDRIIVDTGREVNGNTRLIKIKKEFDSIQRSDFSEEAFKEIQTYFEKSCTELSEIEDLRAKFTVMSDRAFTATVVNRRIKGGKESDITVWNEVSRRGMGDIPYSFKPHAPTNSANGFIHVENDDYNLYLVRNDYGFHNGDKLAALQVAETLWLDFVRQAGIEYE